MVSNSNMANDTDPVMVSGLEHYSYCLRQFALIHLEHVGGGRYWYNGTSILFKNGIATDAKTVLHLRRERNG